MNKRGKGLRLKTVNSIVAYLFMTPTILNLLVWTIFPILVALVLSFTNYDILKHDIMHPFSSGISWMGIDNYAMALDNDIFRRSVLQTIYFAFFSVFFTNIIGLCLALIANNARGKHFFRAAYFIPNITTVAVLVIIFDALFRRGTAMTEFLSLVGIQQVTWSSTEGKAMVLAIIMSVWSGAGYSMLIYLAGLQDISPDVYEAAEIDGASAWQKFRRITFPLLNNKTFFLMATGFIGSLQVYDILQILSEAGEAKLVGGPGGSLWSVVYYIYYVGWSQNKMGRASAVSFLLLIIIGAFTLIQRRVFRDQTY